MTLEDFFTLTEMKNGLATLARVEELVSIMQQQRDCVMSTASDAARQWSSVANTLAATEDGDCLNHFVSLNGLSYLNQWLQDALKFSDNTSDSAVEELLNSLLGCLQKLPVHKEDPVSSGVLLTVEQLIEFKSFDIKEKAKALSERWKQAAENDISMTNDVKREDDILKPLDDSAVNETNLTCPVVDNSTCTRQEESNCREESEVTVCQSHHSDVAASGEDTKLGNAYNVTTVASRENAVVPASSLDMAAAKADLEDTGAIPSASAPNAPQEGSSKKEDVSICSAVERSSSATCSTPPGGVADERCDASECMNDTADETKMEVEAKVGSPLKSAETESCKALPSSGLSISSHTSKPERSMSLNVDLQQMNPYKLETKGTLPRSASIDCVVPKYLKNIDLRPDMQDLVSNGSKLRIDDDDDDADDDDSEGSHNSTDEIASPTESKEADSGSELNFGGAAVLCDSPKPAERSAVKMDEDTDLGLEYGVIDALEVARQVAIEVEREVVDYREPFCSPSPEDNSPEDIEPQCSGDQHGLSRNEQEDGRGSRHDRDNDNASLPNGDGLRIAETRQNPDKREDVDLSKPLTHEPSDKFDKSRCAFDLNEDAFVEDESESLMDCTANNAVGVSTPIAVAASKGAPNFPVSPRRFEGENGWKGSAATSAFRPASPRRTPDIEKTSSGQKRKANCIEIDLNVAESGEEAIDPVSARQIPGISGIPSQEDSVEVNSRRADRLKLDLNRLGDEDIVSPFPPSCWSISHKSGDRTMSPASSSSSRQPTTRDFDLNDNPTYFDAMGSHNLSRFSLKTSAVHASSKPDNPVITILGSKIADRHNYTDEGPISFMGNGPSVAPRAMVPYSHIPLSAYGPLMGPPMPFPPPSFYSPGNVPYMVDSRGAAVMPQFLNNPGLGTAPSALPPFLMSMSNPTPGLSGAGTSQSGLDLNSGFMSLESGSREAGQFRNFFAQGQQNGLAEDSAVRAAHQPGATSAQLNRKETDSGWESYAFGYKQVSSWQ